MGKRRFILHFSMYSESVDVAEIELDDAVIEAVDDEFEVFLASNEIKRCGVYCEHIGALVPIKEFFIGEI